MKKIRFLGVVLLLCFVPAFAAPKIDPATYTVPVHVSAARYDPAVPLNQILSVVIAGKHYEIEGPTSSAKVFTKGTGLLNQGDYPAKLVEDTHKSTFESIQIYEILLPDGTTRRFAVIMQAE
jgi:hypothetical protein